MNELKCQLTSFLSYRPNSISPDVFVIFGVIDALKWSRLLLLLFRHQ